MLTVRLEAIHRHRTCMMAVAAVAVLLASCAEPKPIVSDPNRPASPLATSSDRPALYRSHVTAQSLGTVHISGHVHDNGYNFVASSPGGDQPVEVSHSANGDEGEHCGTGWRRSQSQAVARFTPQNNPAIRDYGFSLLVNPRAHGGWFQHSSLGPVCGQGEHTTGDAQADARGTLHLTFNGKAGTKERLLIRIEGSHAKEANVQLTDVNGKALRLKKKGKGFVAVLSKQGPYQLTASLSSAASASRGCPTCRSESSKSVSVHVQSMRDALTLGYSHGSQASYKIPFPVFVSVKDLERELKKGLFDKTGGKFYPCLPDEDDCGLNAQKVYLRDPRLSVEGAWVILRMRLGGHATIWNVFSPTVTGEIQLSGIPSVSRNVLFLDSLAIETKSKDDLVNYVSASYGDKLREKVQAKTRIDLKPLLDERLAEARSNFPIKLGSACLMLNPTNVTVEEITTTDTPDDEKGIVAKLAVVVQESDVDECQS